MHDDLDPEEAAELAEIAALEQEIAASRASTKRLLWITVGVVGAVVVLAGAVVGLRTVGSGSAQSANPYSRWCGDSFWVNSASNLYVESYANDPNPVTAQNIAAGMTETGGLWHNYLYMASVNQMPAGLDHDELEAYLVTVAQQAGQGVRPQAFASAIVADCPIPSSGP